MSCNAVYNVFEEQREIEQAGRRATFGIVVCQGDAGLEIMRVPNVSTDRSVVALVVEKCNRLHASPMHLMEILEDFWGTDVF